MLIRAEFDEGGLREVQIVADSEDENRAGIRLYERLRPGLLELDQVLRETCVPEATPRRSRRGGGGGGGVGEAG